MSEFHKPHNQKDEVDGEGWRPLRREGISWVHLNPLHVGLVVLWTQATQKMSRIHLTPAKDPFTMFWREHSLAIVVS